MLRPAIPAARWLWWKHSIQPFSIARYLYLPNYENQHSKLLCLFNMNNPPMRSQRKIFWSSACSKKHDPYYRLFQTNQVSEISPINCYRHSIIICRQFCLHWRALMFTYASVWTTTASMLRWWLEIVGRRSNAVFPNPFAPATLHWGGESSLFSSGPSMRLHDKTRRNRRVVESAPPPFFSSRKLSFTIMSYLKWPDRGRRWTLFAIPRPLCVTTYQLTHARHFRLSAYLRKFDYAHADSTRSTWFHTIFYST